MNHELIKYTMVRILRYIGNFWVTFEEIRDDFGYEPEYIQEALEELMRRKLVTYDGVGYELPDDVYDIMEYTQFNAILNSRLFNRRISDD